MNALCQQEMGTARDRDRRGDRVTGHVPACRKLEEATSAAEPGGCVEHHGRLCSGRLRGERAADRVGNEPARQPHSVDRQPMHQFSGARIHSVDRPQSVDDRTTPDDHGGRPRHPGKEDAEFLRPTRSREQTAAELDNPRGAIVRMARTANHALLPGRHHGKASWAIRARA